MSRVTFQDSTDGKMVTATFDLQDVKKSDVHVSYQNDKVVISWESVTTDERTEGERVIRERREKKYVRTLPLPDGTKVRIDAIMDAACHDHVFFSTVRRSESVDGWTTSYCHIPEIHGPGEQSGTGYRDQVGLTTCLYAPFGVKRVEALGPLRAVS